MSEPVPHLPNAENIRKYSFSIRGLATISILSAALVFLSLLIFSGYTYRSAINEREQISNWYVDQLRAAQNLRHLYQRYEQEWKDILLRGHNPDNYHKHLSGFYELERDIESAIDELALEYQPDREPLQALKTFAEEFSRVNRLYRRALRSFNETYTNPQSTADAITRDPEIDPSRGISLLIDALESSRQRSYQDITLSIQRAELLIYLVIFVITVVYLAGLFYLVNRLIIAPVNKGISLAEDISHGKLDKRIEISHAAEEAYQLLESLNRMQSYVREAQKELITARDQAEDSNRAKSDFLSRMSHELRTPLNAILGFGQLLQFKTSGLDENNMEHVEEILKAGQHLLKLINEILDLSRIESDNLDITITDITLSDVAEECLSLTKPLAEQRSVILHNRVPDKFIYIVRGDFLRLKQVLINLISNAIKYGNEGGEVILDCDKVTEEELRITVTDNGPGIPQEKQHLLFKPFERLDISYKIEGTGIGLALTKRLVELMHGTVGVESSPGNGSTFWISLPLAKVLPASDTPAKQPEVELTNPDVSGRKQYVVLYVEDNPPNIRLVETLLKSRSDIKLVTAHTGSLGLDMANAFIPDLVLLDIHLPEMSGFQVLEALKKNEMTREIPVIAVSANAMSHDIEAGKQAGFLDYMIKPINVPQFYQRLEQVLPPIPW